MIIEVMKIAIRFSLKKLELKISEEISSIMDSENVLEMLNEAIASDLEGLRKTCYAFIDERPLEILQNNNIRSLTQVLTFFFNIKYVIIF